ncbi:hypothetical protein ACWKW6_12005 [Dyadobacter jiangsuensis]
MSFGNLTLYVVLLTGLFLACSKDKNPVEPVNSGEIIFNSKYKGSLDTGSVGLARNAKGEVYALDLRLMGSDKQNRKSIIIFEYGLPPETKEVPEGQFTFREGDTFKYTINMRSPSTWDVSSYNQRQMAFSLHKIDGSRYSIEFNGIADTHPMSGKYLGRLRLEPK